jgi:hypothetical protein
MYAKLVLRSDLNSYQTSYQVKYFLNDIIDVIRGSYTLTTSLRSSVFNRGASVIIPDATDSSYYSDGSGSVTSSNSSSQYLAATKTHHANPSMKTRYNISFRYNYGFNVTMGNSNGANSWPNGSVHYALGYSPFGTGTSSSSTYALQSCKEVHIVATKYSLVIQMIATDGKYYTFVLNDLDYIEGVDDYNFSSNSYVVPQVGIMSYANNMVPTQVATTAGFVVYRPQFSKGDGTYSASSTTTDTAATMYHWNPMVSSSYTLSPYPSIYPIPCSVIREINGTGGVKSFPLIPVMYNGSGGAWNSTKADPRHGTMTGMYRVSDNAGNTGDTITVGGETYRLFKIHRSGNGTVNINQPDVDDARDVAVYAFKEIVGA